MCRGFRLAGGLLPVAGGAGPTVPRSGRGGGRRYPRLAGAHLARAVPGAPEARTPGDAAARTAGSHSRTDAARDRRCAGDPRRKPAAVARPGGRSVGGSLYRRCAVRARAPAGARQADAARHNPLDRGHAYRPSAESLAPGPADARALPRDPARTTCQSRGRRISHRHGAGMRSAGRAGRPDPPQLRRQPPVYDRGPGSPGTSGSRFMRHRDVANRRPLHEIEVQVPETLRQMIETQIERLSAEEQRALEVASVAGAVFSVDIAANAADVEPDHFEDLYAALARRHRIIRPADPRQFPDGSDSSRYEFVHALYREVLYRRQAPRSRAKLHRRIGECLEKLLLREAREIGPDDLAAQLAHHFEQGNEWDKALRYTRLASDVAVKRYSPNEALSILGRGLDLVGNLRPEERPAAELQLLERAAMIAAANYHPTALQRYEALESKAKEYGKPDVQD